MIRCRRGVDRFVFERFVCFTYCEQSLRLVVANCRRTIVAREDMMPQIKLRDDREKELAARSGRSLHAFLRAHRFPQKPFLLRASGEGEHKTVAIPSTAAYAILEVLEELSEGREVLLDSLERELSTQEAADLLQVSRPFLIQNLLETGKIPFHRVGNRRRIRLADVMRYKREREKGRKEALRELVDQAQELEMGYG